MPRPSPEELEIALRQAEQMRGHDQDPDHIAKALLSLNYRMHYMDRLLSQTKRYLNSGQAAMEHSKLLKFIAEAEQAGKALGADGEKFGLE
jgi:hypothetical protein